MSKSKKSALKGRRTLDHMLRLLRRDDLDVNDLAARYDRPVAAIVTYLRERGFNIYGQPLPPAPKHDERRPLVLSAGGSAHHVAATSGLSVPTTPVVHRNGRPTPTGLDWKAISPDTRCTCGSKWHAPECPAWTVQGTLRVAESGSPGLAEGGRYKRTLAIRERSGPLPRFTPAQDAEIRRQYESGTSARELADRWGAADVTIANAIRRAGGITRGRSRPWSQRSSRMDKAS